MKKSIFLMAGLVGLALTSCKEDNSLGTMQKNEAPVIVAADGVAIQSRYAATGNKINLQDYEQSTEISLVDIEIATSFPENSTVTGQLEIADNPDFKDAQTLALNTVQASSKNAALAEALGTETRSLTGVVNAILWNDAFVSFYGLNPATRTNYLRYRLWLNNDKQNVILYDNNGNEWFDAMEFTVTPIDAKLDVAPSYSFNYLVNLEGEIHSQVMYHNPDKHVYDDPTFNTTVEVTETEAGEVNVVYWWITPGENSSGTPYGVSVSDPAAESGSLGVINGEEFGNGQLETPGVFKIEVNMLELEYNVKLAPPSLYVVSTNYITFANAAQLGTEDNVLYTGMAGIESGWGLTGQSAYKPTLYSNNPDEAVTKAEDGTVTGGIIFDTSGAPLNDNSAIPLPGQRGMYYVTANLQTLQYTAYRCNELGITGSMEGINWGEGKDIALKNSRTTYYMQWSGTLEVNAGDNWKIRANSDWAVNFGSAGDGSYATDGTDVELVMGGENFVAPETGKYNVTVYLRRVLENGEMTPYRMTVTPAN